MNKPIYYIDASALKDSACMRKLYWTVIKGYAPSYAVQPTFKMDYGTAFHLFLADIYAGKSNSDAALKAINWYSNRLLESNADLGDDFRTVDHLANSIKAYLQTYRAKDCCDGLSALVINSNPMIEQKFAWPFYECDKFALMLSGIIDMVGEYVGQRCLVDHKSTAIKGTDSFFNQFEFDIQPMFYSWIDNLVNQRGDVYLPFIINGIFIKKPSKTATSAGHFDGVWFERSKFIEFTPEQMKEFSVWFKHRIETLIMLLNTCNDEEIEKCYEPSFCRTPYGSCKYFNVCKAVPEARNSILDGLFTTKEYNPLTRYED